MRLNKFLARAGIESRRKADELIQMATTEVNGKICLDPAYNVKDSDEVKYDGQKIKPILEKVVIMLHKPKKVITTVKDTHGRITVLDIVHSKYRLTPIGRLDQDTTGLLLLTNDGDLHHYLTHPKNQICRDYEVVIENEIPIPVELSPIVYSNGNFTINWSMNSENDFKVYNLKESLSSDMSAETLVFSSTSKHDTVFVIENILEGDDRFYQVTVIDTGNLSSGSNIAYAAAPIISYQKEFGGQGIDIAYSVQQTADEGLIIAGRTDSWGNGGIDGWLIKTNIEGHEEWNYTYRELL